MGTAWFILVEASALGVAVGLTIAWFVVRRGLRGLERDAGDASEARSVAVHALRNSATQWVCGPAALAPLCGVAVARIFVDGEFPMGAAYPALFVSVYVGCLLSLPMLLDIEERLQGPGWSRPAVARLWLWAMLSSGAVTTLLGWGAGAAAHELSPWPQSDGLRSALGFMVGASVGLVLLGRLFVSIGTVHALPEPLRDALQRVAGPDPLPELLLWRTGGRGTWQAFAYAARRRRLILVTEDIVASFPTDEVTAILLHELGHHRLGHLRVREAHLVVALVAAPLACGLLFSSAPMLVAGASWLVLWAGGPWLFARQEIASDAFAARHVPPEVVGRALVHLVRMQMVPGNRQIASSHPALRSRLVHLGLDADAMLAAAVAPPASEPAPQAA